MKKSTRIVKKLLALFLVVLMSINTFAAVVGDNDGAAFITKAEFDSLKNDFQSQLDRYNSSIDNKIDGAIASYLAGVKVASKMKLTDLNAKYQISGSVENILLWSSATDYKINKNSNQKATIDLTLMAHAGTTPKEFKGWRFGLWHTLAEKEANDRKAYRWQMDSKGQITCAGLTELRYSGVLYFAVWGADTARGSYGLSQIATKNFKGRKSQSAVVGGVYMRDFSGSTEPAYTSEWAGMEFVSYSESITKATRSCAVAPLNTSGGEYVYDDRVKDHPTLSTDGRRSLNTHSEFLWTASDISMDETNDWIHQADGIISTSGLSSYQRAFSNDFKITSVQAQEYVDFKCSGIFTSATPSEFIFTDLKSINTKNEEIKKGVVLCDIPDDGTVDIKGTVSDDSYLILYNAKKGDVLWGGKRTSATDVTSWKISDNEVTAGDEFHKTIKDCKKDEAIFYLLLPKDTTTLAFLDVSEIIFTGE